MAPGHSRDVRLTVAPHRHPRTATFAVLGVLYWTAHSMMRPLVGTYVLSLGGTETEASVALAAFSLFPTLLAILIGGVVDHWGTRPILILGATLMVAGGGLILVPQLVTVIASQVLLGLGTLCVWVSLQTSVTSARGAAESRDARAGRIATFALFASVGQTAGPAIGGFLQSGGGYELAYATYVSLSLVLLVVAVVLAPRQTEPRVRRGGTPILRPYRDAAALLRHRTVTIAVLVSFTALLLHDIRTAWQPVLLHGAGMPQWQIGAVISVSALAGLAARPFFGLLLRAVGTTAFVGLVVVVGAATAMLVTVAPHSLPYVISVGAVNGLAVGFAQPLSLTLLSDEVPPGRLGIASGLRSMGNQAALLTSPAAFGAVAAVASVSAGFLVVGGAAALVGVLSAVLLARASPRRVGRVEEEILDGGAAVEQVQPVVIPHRGS